MEVGTLAVCSRGEWYSCGTVCVVPGVDGAHSSGAVWEGGVELGGKQEHELVLYGMKVGDTAKDGVEVGRWYTHWGQ